MNTWFWYYDKELSKAEALISRAHLKCPLGQAWYPWSPQGLQSRVWFTSITLEFSESGPNPNWGTVELKIAVTGAFVDEAKCSGAESLTKFIFASCINDTDSKGFSFPAKLTTSTLFISLSEKFHY